MPKDMSCESKSQSLFPHERAAVLNHLVFKFTDAVAGYLVTRKDGISFAVNSSHCQAW